MYYSADDQYIWTEDMKVLPREQLSIPGLHMIGYRNFRHSYEELNLHYHNTMEIVVTLKGKHHFIADNKLHTLYGGDIFMTTPKEPHGGSNSPQAISEFVWFQFDLSSPKDFLGLPDKYNQYVFEQLINYHHRTKKAHAKDLPLLKDAFFLLASNNIQQQILGYNSFIHFVVNNLCRFDTSLQQSRDEDAIYEAMTYMNSHLTENLNIDAIAEYVHLSPTRFKVKFKEYVGITPHAYIISLRVDTAKVLLKNPLYSITQIAYMLNFSSSNHFATVFKKYTGYTPTEFKSSRFHDAL